MDCGMNFLGKMEIIEPSLHETIRDHIRGDGTASLIPLLEFNEEPFDWLTQ